MIQRSSFPLSLYFSPACITCVHTVGLYVHRLVVHISSYFVVENRVPQFQSLSNVLILNSENQQEIKFSCPFSVTVPYAPQLFKVEDD